MKIGRNDPCPCGSGIKYKKCCAGSQEAGSQEAGTEQPKGMGAVMGELRELLKGQNFGSLEEANDFLRQYMQKTSEAPVADFHGLSSEQMHRLLHFPFETPDLVTLPARLDIMPQAPIMSLFKLLVEAIGEDGLKPTATGNLPRNFCREAALSYLGEDGYMEMTRYGGINTEHDFEELHVTRVVAELAGLIRKYRGKFILSRECRKLLAEGGSLSTYPPLFKASAREFNWGYRDRYPDLPIVQQSFLFTLYLLKRYGNDWRTSAFYADNFLRAFPAVLAETTPSSYTTKEESVTRCYTIRALERFAEFFGLIEIDREGADRFSDQFRLRRLPLLEHVVLFHTRGGEVPETNLSSD